MPTTLTITHAKVSSIPDSGDSALLEPSDWNANHVLTGSFPFGPGSIRVVTIGTVTVTSDDGVIVVNNPSTSPNPFVMPAVATRTDLWLSVYKWDSNGGDMTFTPNGTETFMGLSTWTVISASAAGGGGSVTMVGSTAMSGWLVR